MQVNIIEDYGLQGAFDGRPLPLGVVGGKMQTVRIPSVSESWEWRKKFRPVLTLRQIADAGFSDEEKSEAAYQEYIEGIVGLFRDFLPAMGCDVAPEQFSVLQLMEAFENVYQMLDLAQPPDCNGPATLRRLGPSSGRKRWRQHLAVSRSSRMGAVVQVVAG